VLALAHSLRKNMQLEIVLSIEIARVSACGERTAKKTGTNKARHTAIDAIICSCLYSTTPVATDPMLMTAGA